MPDRMTYARYLFASIYEVVGSYVVLAILLQQHP